MPIIPATSIAVQDEAVIQGHVGTLNFTGAGVGAAVVGDIATITIAGGGGAGASATRVLLTIPFPAELEKKITIVDAAVSATSRINTWLSGLGPSVIGCGQMVDMKSVMPLAAAGSFELLFDFATPFAGSLSVDYMVLA